MSVSDPIIKELKGHVLLLVGIKPAITDEEDILTAFCDCVERIFRYGIITQFTSFGNCRPPDPWFWLEQIAETKYRAPFSYQSSVEMAKKCPKVKTNQGRLRLLIRSCLMKRCLHVPVQTLIHSGESGIIYSSRSIIGDEILSEILLSVLMLTSKLQFTLDLSKARFLDDTWTLPVTRHLQFVPCTELGLTLAFVDGKAITISVLPNSIASEEDQVEIGDVLDELNSVPIVPTVQGSLGNILKKASGHPVTAHIIKAEWRGEIYSPLLPHLKRAGVNVRQLQNKISGSETMVIGEELSQDDKLPVITWMGKVPTGEFGDVKQIRKALETLLKEKQDKINVTFDCQDLGVYISDRKTNKILLHHAYMQISSCGSTVSRPNFFAYIAEDKMTDITYSHFMCYIFHCNDTEKGKDLKGHIMQYENCRWLQSGCSYHSINFKEMSTE